MDSNSIFTNFCFIFVTHFISSQFIFTVQSLKFFETSRVIAPKANPPYLPMRIASSKSSPEGEQSLRRAATVDEQSINNDVFASNAGKTRRFGARFTKMRNFTAGKN